MIQRLSAMAAVSTLACGALLAPAAQAAPVQWTVASGGNGHWYELVEVSTDWASARADALSRTWLGLGGYLATITSATENRFASVTVAGGVTAYLGGSDAAVEGEWRWIDGPEAGQLFWSGDANGTGGYASWNAGEPNQAGDEDAVHTNYANNTGGWNDINVGGGYFYLVEYSQAATVPEPGSAALVLGALMAAGAAARRRR